MVLRDPMSIKHWVRFQVDADSDKHLTLTSETMDVSDGD